MMAMIEYTAYNVSLMRKDTGEDLAFVMTASSPERAKEYAIDKARRQMSTMAERKYAKLEIVSCVVAAIRS